MQLNIDTILIGTSIKVSINAHMEALNSIITNPSIVDRIILYL